MECRDAFGAWHYLSPEKLHEIREKLSNFESMTWHQILVEGKKQNHTVEVSQLSPAARTRLPQMKLNDIDRLVSLRLMGKERIYGIRQGSALLLLWWDPDHAIYPVEKKNT